MIVVDCLIYKDGQLLFWDEKEDMRYQRENDNARAFDEMYKNGTLKELAALIYEDIDKPKNSKYVHFVIDLDVIDDDMRKKIHEKYPHESVTNCGNYSPCHYTGCISLINPIRKTYRDNCGCISSSWELSQVEIYRNEDANDIYDIWMEKGSIEAGKEAVLRYYRINNLK